MFVHVDCHTYEQVYVHNIWLKSKKKEVKFVFKYMLNTRD